MPRHDPDDDSGHALQEAESALKHDDLPTPLRQQLQLTVAMYRDMLERERQGDIEAPRGMHMPSSASGGISGWHLVGHTVAILAGIGSLLTLGIALTNDRIDDLAQRVGSMDQSMGSMDQRLGSMNRRVTSVDRRMDTLDHTVTSLDQRVTSLDQTITSLDGRVSSLEGEMEVVQLDVSETRALVSAIANELGVSPSLEIR